MSLSERVLEQILKRIELPNSLSLFLIALIDHEVEKNYPSLLHSRHHTPTDDELFIAYTKTIHDVLVKLPPVEDVGVGMFNATIGQLTGIDLEFGMPNTYGLHIYQPKDKNYLTANTETEYYAMYRTGTMWEHVLNFRVSFDIPKNLRFEHTHVLGNTGSGKTTLLQSLITKDIQTNASVIVMAPKGNMIPTLAKLSAIAPDRLILIRPEDPIALNVFDLGTGTSEADTNNAVDLIGYIFASILDAETTSKQTGLLNYCIRLLLAVPGATVLDMREIMKSDTLPDKYAEFVPKLNAIAQDFFHTQFTNKKLYGETKEQMMWRLDRLLENSTILRIFSQPKTRLNIGSVMAGGKVLLIDTSIKNLGEFGSSFLGRFMIALVHLATMQRDTSRPLRAVYFYIDEAQTYINDKIEKMLELAREAKVGLTIAHQQLEQLANISQQLKASVIANTSTKYIGRCSHTDAQLLAHEMRVSAEALQHQEPLHFTFKASGFLKSALPVTVHWSEMDKYPKRTEAEQAHVVEQIRKQYAPTIPEKMTVNTPAVTPLPSASPSDDDDVLKSFTQGTPP